MKTIKHLIILVITMVSLASCGGLSQQEANAEGFGTIENEIKSKFGDNAYYTDLTITYNESIGNIVGVTVTDNPASLKMGQWNLMQGSWKQNSEITLEVPEGTKASDYMFQLGDKINMAKLGGLTEKSMEQLKTEKDIEHPNLEMAFIKFPKNGDLSKAEYKISLKPENGGTSFQFNYTLDGELINMDY